MITTARNIDLPALAALLKDEKIHKVDAVVPARSMIARQGRIELTGMDPVHTAESLTDDGVTAARDLDMNSPFSFEVSDIALGHLAEKLGVHISYLRRIAAERPDLFDANVNGWLTGDVSGTYFEGLSPAEPDSRSFLLRMFRPAGDDEFGTLRGVLSDRFAIIDHLDVLTAALRGIKAAGVTAHIVGCDLTEQRMRVRVVVPEAQVWAHELFRDYKTPFGGGDNGGVTVRVGDAGGWTIEKAREAARREGHEFPSGQEPIVFAGFEINNGELGNAAAGITPYALANICGNGLRISAEAERRTHLGGKLDAGVIKWSAETRALELDTLTSKVKDAARTFAAPAYWEAKIKELEIKAGKAVDKNAIKDKAKVITVKTVATEADLDAIMDHFLLGGQQTAGGLMNAFTSYAQTVADPEKAAALEADGIKILDLI